MFRLLHRQRYTTCIYFGGDTQQQIAANHLLEYIHVEVLGEDLLRGRRCRAARNKGKLLLGVLVDKRVDHLNKPRNKTTRRDTCERAQRVRTAFARLKIL